LDSLRSERRAVSLRFSELLRKFIIQPQNCERNLRYGCSNRPSQYLLRRDLSFLEPAKRYLKFTTGHYDRTSSDSYGHTYVGEEHGGEAR
ncbi:MAG: hypothetical protein AAF662_15075, partial [Pseudomonadota bacterium]